MNRDGLIARALAAYPFRARRIFDESAAAYLDAMIAHVADRDLAAAHEIRVGREQSAWTPEDIAAFVDRITPSRPPREILRPGTAIAMTEIGTFEVSEPMLIRLATSALDLYCEDRRRQPDREFPIMVNVLLTDGRLLIGPVGRGDRVAIVTHLARTMSVFGFFIVADVFIHGVSAIGSPDAHADKTDAFVAHVGTRDLRRVMMRRYRVIDGRRAEFHAPDPDLDKRGRETLHDPYAGVFAMPPTPGARTS